MKEKRIYQIFEISLILKGIDGLLGIAGALFLFLVNPTKISGWVTPLILHELSEDPGDKIATYLFKVVQNFTFHTQIVQALYLLTHGLLKIFLVWGLLKNKLWAYSTSIMFLILFIFYQVYRYTITHSPWLLLLTLFDALIIILTWHEYKIQSKNKNTK